jgi:hypothetical protein
MARPERFELPTLCFEGRCSIQLSYGRVVDHLDDKPFLDSVSSFLASTVRALWQYSI